MKTFEMVKLADENGRTYENNGMQYQSDKGFLFINNLKFNIYGISYLSYFIHLDGWQLQRKYITFMEAAEKSEQGRTICCELNKAIYTFHPGHIFLIDEYEEGITISQILYGEWYVKEDEPK